MNTLIPLLFIAASCMSVMVHAQQNSPSPAKDCGCAYKPLCHYDITRSYAGKVYKGIRNDDESISYYHCENGVLTAKWTWKVWNDMNEEYDYYNYTRILLKENARPGEVWTEHAPDGRYYDRYVVKKHTSYTVYGQTYKDVIQVRQLDKQYPWKTDKELVDYYEALGSTTQIFRFGWEALYVTDFYYARGQGQIHSEKITKQFIKEVTAKVLGPQKEYNRNSEADLRQYLAAHNWIEPWSFGKGQAVEFTTSSLMLGPTNLGRYEIRGSEILVGGEGIFIMVTNDLGRMNYFTLK
ncbi:MAG TPA: hypothetical protein PKD90_07680 [Phnomibacter sp.]|nr:hypothetical protein [Phnomibacter sp.]